MIFLWFNNNYQIIIEVTCRTPMTCIQYEGLNSYFSFNKSVSCKMKLFTHNKGDRQIFMFKLKSMCSPDKFKAFFCPALKYHFFNHIATSPDTQISYPVPNNMSLCENRTFLLTILKQVQESLYTSSKYIGSYFLSILLFPLPAQKSFRFRKT